MKPFLWFFSILVVAGVIFYGFAKIVLLTILIAGGAFVVAACACGISRSISESKRKPPDPLNPSADEFRALKSEQEWVLMQAKALRTIPSSASDSELAELRRLAGLN